jgi:hypothetical protein
MPNTRVAGQWWLVPVILANWKAEMGMIEVQGCLGKWFSYFTSKVTRAKCTEVVAQVAECLFCKCKALSSKP